MDDVLNEFSASSQSSWVIDEKSPLNSANIPGSGNDTYDTTARKDENDLGLAIATCGKQQVAVKNRAVTKVKFASYNMEDCPDIYLQFPNYLRFNSTKEDLESLETGFEK